MKFLIISHAIHKVKSRKVYSYAPYVREMNLWLKYVDEVTIIAPKTETDLNKIEINYKHDNLELKVIPNIQFTNLKHVITSIFRLPILFISILNACRKADHIHLRCPGNIGLIGCFAQLFFPKKIKTAKYAGNWDPKAKQPKSYRLQKWILSNTNLTKNIQVLVYGDWKNQTRNIKSFFTATYRNSEKEQIIERDYSSILNFVFVGSLVSGKRPLLAIKIVEALSKRGRPVRLDLFGDGVLKEELKSYVIKYDLQKIITLHGNQTKEVVQGKLKASHFSILPSKSEGWPKAIAEAMFYGVIPVVTKISCVPYMLDKGNRGILIEPELNKAIAIIEKVIDKKGSLKKMGEKALLWSQGYTLDTFEEEIKKLLER